jgi:hypothetical protein
MQEQETLFQAAKMSVTHEPAQAKAKMLWPPELLPAVPFTVKELPKKISKLEQSLDIAIVAVLLLPILLALLIGVLFGTPLQEGFLGHSARGLALIFLLAYIFLRGFRHLKRIVLWSLPVIALLSWLALELDTALLHLVIYWAINQFSTFPHAHS